MEPRIGTRTHIYLDRFSHGEVSYQPPGLSTVVARVAGCAHVGSFRSTPPMSQQKQRRRSQRAIATTTTTATLLLIVVVLSLSVAAGPQPAEAASVALPSSLKAHAKAALRPILARARALIEAAEAATGAAEAPAAASEASRPQPTKPAAAAEEGDDVAAAAAAAFDSITGGAGSSGSVGSGSGVRGHGLGVGDDAGGPEGPGRIRMLSWEPRAMLWEGFMTEEGERDAKGCTKGRKGN